MTVQPGWSRSPAPRPDSLADVLERVLDKGVVIAGDVVVNLLDIELLSLKLRLFIASADTAREMGMDWWTQDPFFNSRAAVESAESEEQRLQAENRELRERLERLEQRLSLPGGDTGDRTGEGATQSSQQEQR